MQNPDPRAGHCTEDRLLTKSSRSNRENLAKKPCRYYTKTGASGQRHNSTDSRLSLHIFFSAVSSPSFSCFWFILLSIGKTGRCNRALTCPYAHIPDRLAICPRYLRSTCPNDASACPLSHTPSAHNTPSCLHFQATASCRNAPTCLYPHVRVAEDAPVCEAFARDGWCELDEGTCPELHVWECGEWRSKGTCSRKGRCGLRHVLRAETGKGSTQEAMKEGMDDEETMTGNVPVEGGFEDGAEFIVFGQGSPRAVSSDETEDDSGESAEDEGSDDEGDDIPNTGVVNPRNGKQRAVSLPRSDLPRTSNFDLSINTDEEDENEVFSVVS